MAIIYKIMEAAPKNPAAPLYVSTQIGTDADTPPFLFCNHRHESKAEAELCREFGMPRNNEQP